MILLIIVAVIVLIVLSCLGVFRKPANCRHCGVELKGTEQKVMTNGLGGSTDGSFILCKNCYDKIHKAFKPLAGNAWDYDDYCEYLQWEEETKDLRASFKPDFVYEGLKIDTEKSLFQITGLLSSTNDLVLRFCDITDYEINFEPKEYKEGIFTDKVKGIEYIRIFTRFPMCHFKEDLQERSYKVKTQGIFNPTYTYEFSDEFMTTIRLFSTLFYCAHQANEQTASFDTEKLNELQKALAMFMFDSIDDVTEENLKKQRNNLIKAFHPDNSSDNAEYSQKINAAYDLLLQYKKTA